MPQELQNVASPGQIDYLENKRHNKTRAWVSEKKNESCFVASLWLIDSRNEYFFLRVFIFTFDEKNRLT